MPFVLLPESSPTIPVPMLPPARGEMLEVTVQVSTSEGDPVVATTIQVLGSFLCEKQVFSFFKNNMFCCLVLVDDKKVYE